VLKTPAEIEDEQDAELQAFLQKAGVPGSVCKQLLLIVRPVPTSLAY
jgi:hypothetical protein